MLARIIVGIATFFVGAIVIWPILGLATWHAYLDTIDAREFPRQAEGIASIPRVTEQTFLD